jgi:hypothetical protein
MDEAAVLAAMQRLEAQGKAPSLGNLRKELGGGSWRDITKWRRAILGHWTVSTHGASTKNPTCYVVWGGSTRQSGCSGLDVLLWSHHFFSLSTEGVRSTTKATPYRPGSSLSACQPRLL